MGAHRKELREEVLGVIDGSWPTHIKEIVRNLGFEVDNSNIKKISYHVAELKKQEKVQVKRVGKALVVWPTEIEKLRAIHELLKV
jgi:predicted transcriptional regulator